MIISIFLSFNFWNEKVYCIQHWKFPIVYHTNPLLLKILDFLQIKSFWYRVNESPLLYWPCEKYENRRVSRKSWKKLLNFQSFRMWMICVDPKRVEPWIIYRDKRICEKALDRWIIDSVGKWDWNNGAQSETSYMVLSSSSYFKNKLNMLAKIFTYANFMLCCSSLAPKKLWLIVSHDHTFNVASLIATVSNLHSQVAYFTLISVGAL